MLASVRQMKRLLREQREDLSREPNDIRPGAACGSSHRQFHRPAFQFLVAADIADDDGDRTQDQAYLLRRYCGARDPRRDVLAASA